MLLCSQQEIVLCNFPLPAETHGRPHSHFSLTSPFRKIFALPADVCSYIFNARIILSRLSTANRAKLKQVHSYHRNCRFHALRSQTVWCTYCSPLQIFTSRHTTGACHGTSASSSEHAASCIFEKLEFNSLARNYTPIFVKVPAATCTAVRVLFANCNAIQLEAAFSGVHARPTDYSGQWTHPASIFEPTGKDPGSSFSYSRIVML